MRVGRLSPRRQFRGRGVDKHGERATQTVQVLVLAAGGQHSWERQNSGAGAGDADAALVIQTQGQRAVMSTCRSLSQRAQCQRRRSWVSTSLSNRVQGRTGHPVSNNDAASAEIQHLNIRRNTRMV